MSRRAPSLTLNPTRINAFNLGAANPQKRIPVELNYPGTARQVTLTGQIPPANTVYPNNDHITFTLNGKTLTVIGMPSSGNMYSGESEYEAVTTVTIAAGSGYPELSASLIFYGLSTQYDGQPDTVNETLTP